MKLKKNKLSLPPYAVVAGTTLADSTYSTPYLVFSIVIHYIWLRVRLVH